MRFIAKRSFKPQRRSRRIAFLKLREEIEGPFGGAEKMTRLAP
jgi:hypothetical protein